MSDHLTTGSQPIAGYTLLERIGTGAYGEVWRAEAPGELVKAVKIIHGFHHEGRAMRELSALQRIKQLRHPFLISLERIEVVDGRLIIVTELADMSLKDRFEQCRQAGATGIPRAELLGYLSDAADALDFIHESQSLQHLDVKAANMLLVGGRLKLGDFGLVQNLAERDVTLLDGMTPRYAAPELFKGQPTQYSDQYSLAVVYAELLAGVTLFDASSPAEFAVQHLIGSKPRLDALPTSDQGPVARALARQPEERYPNCRAFVADLVSRSTPATCAGGGASAAAGSGPTQTVRGEAAGQVTARQDGSRSGRAAGNQSGSPDPGRDRSGQPAAGAPTPPRDSFPPADEMTVVLSANGDGRSQSRSASANVDTRRLPPLEGAEQMPWQPRPTLFIGVGGTANKILIGLRRRLEERFIFFDRIPAWQTLLIDTDAAALEAAGASDASDNDPAAQSLLLKIRTTQEYREGSPQLLKWLSRRWLYNISRVPRTSGWRPLGRLALVDHGPQVMERLRQEIGQFSAPAAVASSAETVNAPFATRPLIVLVASISGGTGSGMVLDLAYAARKVVADLNLTGCELRGILLHGTDQDPDSQDLSRANAYACLTELAHFSRPGCGYPGEDALELPALPSMVPTFDETFLVHLGESLALAEFVDQVDRVSDALYLSLATRAGGVLASARGGESTIGLGQPDPPVHSFGLCAVNSLRRDEIDAFADQVCQAIAARWIGTAASGPLGSCATVRFGSNAGGQSLTAELKDLVEQALGLSADPKFVAELTRSLEHQLMRSAGSHVAEQGGPARLRALSAISAELSELAAALASLRNHVVRSVDVEAMPKPAGKAPLASIRTTVKAFLDEQAGELAANLARDFPRLFLRRERRAGDGAQRAGDTLSGFCRQLRLTVRAGIMQSLKQVDVSRLLLEMIGKSRAAREPLRELLSAANPRLKVADGAERLFVFAPSYADTGSLAHFFQSELQEDATIVRTEDDRLTIYCEGTSAHLTEAAAALIEDNFHYAEVASRLHTRIDVAWASLRPAAKSEALV